MSQRIDPGALDGRPPTTRPAFGVGHYLRDLVYGALDGAITTMAVVAGTAGAHLSPRIGVILGLANLVGDGLSMGASNYLGLKSELEQAGRSVAEEAPWRHGLATFAAFVVVGSLPLMGYVVGPLLDISILAAAGVLAALALLLTGAARAPFVRRPMGRSAGEMLLVGAAAGGAAYAVGALASRFLGAA
jgi:VIT1/CCC1 family predicted Fe2+/Mn2+ transporter